MTEVTSCLTGGAFALVIRNVDLRMPNKDDSDCSAQHNAAKVLMQSAQGDRNFCLDFYRSLGHQQTQHSPAEGDDVHEKNSLHIMTTHVVNVVNYHQCTCACTP